MNKAYEVGDIVWDTHCQTWGIITKSTVGWADLPYWFTCEVYWCGINERNQGFCALTGPNAEKGFENVVRVSSSMSRSFSVLWDHKRLRWKNQEA